MKSFLLVNCVGCAVLFQHRSDIAICKTDNNDVDVLSRIH